MRPPVVVFASLALLALPSCDRSSPAPAPSASASAAVISTASATSLGTPPSPPDDLDVAAAQKALKCAADAKAGPCGVLTKAKTCTPWNPIGPSGDGRWIGRGTAIEAGKSRDTFVVVRSKRVAITEVAPGQLGARIGIAEIPKEDAAFPLADKAIRAFERGDVPQHGNAAIDYVKARSDWPEFYAMKTRSGQIDALTGDGAFLCLGPKQELLLVQRKAKANTDGLYAELWAATW